MKLLKVSDMYNVTQISKTNDEAWSKLIKIMENETEDVQLDFYGIQLEEPWNNETFKMLLSNEHVYIKVYSSEKLKNTLELTCVLGNMKTGRIENEDEVAEEVYNVKNVALDRLVDRFKDSIEIMDNMAVINVQDVVDQVGNISTVDAIEKAIRDINKEQNIKEIAINTDDMFIQINIIEHICTIIGKLRKEGITIKVMTTDTDVASKISIYQCIGSNKVPTQDRVKIFRDTVEPLTVGMLSKYKDTRRLDVFGRKGEGKPISCRVAIFKGFEKSGNDTYAKLTTYNGNFFFTRLHYELDHDGEYLSELVSEDIKVPIQQMGLCDKYLGSLYHFNLPIQYSKDDYMLSYKKDERTDEITMNTVILPEHIKMVLDDFNIKYNNVGLIYAIGETIRFLEKFKSTN